MGDGPRSGASSTSRRAVLDPHLQLKLLHGGALHGRWIGSAILGTEFLMQPIRSIAVMEEVNDNDRPIEPLHYPAVVMGSGELSVMVTASAEGQMCEVGRGFVAEQDVEPQAFEQSIDQIDLKTPGWTRSHVSKVLDFIRITKIPQKHIVKPDILPPNLTQYQRDNAHKNPFSFWHFNMYMHAMELVWMGDTSVEAYEKFTSLIKKFMVEMQHFALVRDGLALKDKIAENGDIVNQLPVRGQLLLQVEVQVLVP